MTLQLPELPEDYTWSVLTEEKLADEEVHLVSNGVEQKRIVKRGVITLGVWGPTAYKGGFIAGTTLKVPPDMPDAQLERVITSAAQSLIDVHVENSVTALNFKKRVARLMGDTE